MGMEYKLLKCFLGSSRINILESVKNYKKKEKWIRFWQIITVRKMVSWYLLQVREMENEGNRCSASSYIAKVRKKKSVQIKITLNMTFSLQQLNNQSNFFPSQCFSFLLSRCICLHFLQYGQQIRSGSRMFRNIWKCLQLLKIKLQPGICPVNLHFHLR